jgi:hypothetical protein
VFWIPHRDRQLCLPHFPSLMHRARPPRIIHILTLSPAAIPEGQSERLILKNVENSVRGKILFLDLELQKKVLDFLLSPTETELTKQEIYQFLHSKQDFNFLSQMNNALKMLNKKLDDSQQLQNQINDLAELFFVSTLNGYY